jgi:transposase-like protein
VRQACEGPGIKALTARRAPKRDSDAALLKAAIAKAGGTAARLARELGLEPNTPNAWRHRIRQGGQLSADKRARLRTYVDGERPAVWIAALERQPAPVVRRAIARLTRALQARRG